jgi:hypothetical protein
MGGTPVTSVPGYEPGNGFGDVDCSIQISVDGVSALFTPEEDAGYRRVCSSVFFIA